MRRPLMLLLLLGSLQGCATGGASTSQEDPMALPDRFSIRYRGVQTPHQTVLPVPVQRVMREVPAAFDDMGFPVASAAAADHPTFITPTLELTGELFEGDPNEDYFKCDTPLSGARWAANRVHFVVMTQLRATEDGGTLVETMVEATAWDRWENLAENVCVGTGKLEGAIAANLRARLSR